MRRTRLAVVVCAAATAIATNPGDAAGATTDHRSALFALIIGVNASPDPDVPALQYADDDAARYLDLFRALGAAPTCWRASTTTRAACTPRRPRRRCPHAAKSCAGRSTALAHDVAQARARGVRSVLYVIYAGHGDVHRRRRT